MEEMLSEEFMVQMYHVDKVYEGEIVALRDVTFRIPKGQFVFVTGPSGAGKSTLLKLILCSERPTRGQILVENRNITRISRSQIPTLRRRMGFVFQDFKLLNSMTVYENVAFALRVTGYAEAEVRKRVSFALRSVQLERKAQVNPLKLSGGERQRVAIARALVHGPSLLLADEPTGNLDPELTLDILHLFHTINSTGTTVIFATHDQHLLRRYRQPIIALERGRVVHCDLP
jgi:cell division transport system ATP-binding protein